jgi:hypothetical protein
VASAFPDRPGVLDRAVRFDRKSNAEYATGTAQYRRHGEVPRQRVAYIQADGGETPVRDDHHPVSHRWTGSRPDVYETDWSPRHHRKGRRRAHRGRRTLPVLIAMGAVSAAVGAIVAIGGAKHPATVDAALQQRASAPQAGEVRDLAAPVAPTSPSSSSSPKVSRPKSPAQSRPPRPVSGLNQAQMNNAAVIVQVAQERGLPRRAMLVAMMTGLQESDLRNLANPTVPASLGRPNEGSGANFDSLGVFQQRPSQGWGTVAQLMNPHYAADAFYKKLLRISDWESKSLGDAAQAVQRSGVPGAYAGREKRATQIVDALL